MKVTVIGGRGFIGSHLISKLSSMGVECQAPERSDPSIFSSPLGHVIYCAGLTSDFRSRPYDTVRAHVSYLTDLLEQSDFASFLYLSSTRVYSHQPSYSIGYETSKLITDPSHQEELFNLTKLTGESLCLTVDRPNVRIARVSNVVGDDFESNNFVYSIIKDAIQKGKIVLHTSLDSVKDYIHISDVTDVLIKIAFDGKSKTYNVASGKNTSNKELTGVISKLTSCSVETIENPKSMKFPLLSIDKIKEEFRTSPRNILDTLPDLISLYIKRMKG